MKVLFRNTTKYDKENCNSFIKFHSEKYGKKELIKFILIAIAMIYIAIFNVIYKNWILLLVLIVCALLFYLIKNINQKNKKKEKVKKFTFYFYENYIKIKYKKQYERMLYFEFKKIFETKDNFFLYTDENHSLILDKDGFEIGTPAEFSKFIKNKCPLKYRKERNEKC